MQKYIFGICLMMVIPFAFSNAQDRKAPVKRTQSNYEIMLGKGEDYKYITLSQWDSIIKLPIFLKDAKGIYYEADAFEVIYAEWDIFEDSTGREKIMTEYYLNSIMGGQIPSYLQEHLTSMAKDGDTLTIQNVWSHKKDASGARTIVQEASSKRYVIKK